MKKFLSVILCATVALTLTACRNEEQRQKQIASYAREQHEKEQSEYWESREAEISLMMLNGLQKIPFVFMK